GDDVPEPASVAGVITVPFDPAHPPTAALPVALALAGPAGFAVESVASPAPGLAESCGAYLAARHREIAHAGVVAAPVHELDWPPADAIVRHVADGHTSFLCMATHGRGVVAGWALGSVASEVVSRSPVPVVLVGPAVRHAGTPIRHVLAATDAWSVAGAAHSAAERLAGLLGADLDVVDVQDDREGVRTLAARAGAKGDTLVVVACHPGEGHGRAAAGSPARELARHAACPVMVVPTEAAG
ncbi:MAG TPA: universal stress protein, partial [Acidimicrobiales bacterium]|nr:universal stress protein [Acidimicrobiales bacterium]